MEEGEESGAFGGDEGVGAGKFEKPSGAGKGDDRAKKAFFGRGAGADDLEVVDVKCAGVEVGECGGEFGVSNGGEGELLAPAVDVGEVAADVAGEGGDGELGAGPAGRSGNEQGGLAHGTFGTGGPVGGGGPDEAGAGGGVDGGVGHGRRGGSGGAGDGRMVGRQAGGSGCGGDRGGGRGGFFFDRVSANLVAATGGEKGEAEEGQKGGGQGANHGVKSPECPPVQAERNAFCDRAGLVRRGGAGKGGGMILHTMGDTAYLVGFTGAVDAAMLARVRGFAAGLAADRLPGVTEIVPAYASVGVIYEPERVGAGRGELPWRIVAEWLERHMAGKGGTAGVAAAKKARGAGREHVFPVVYGGEDGPDLEAVAKAAKLGTADVVKLHAGATYRVAAIGFMPGFPYLLGLPETLATARRATPRLRVAAGSVGIGGAQAGIYPRESPGGWQIIGRTAAELFDPARSPDAALLAAGDTVKFKAVAALPVKTTGAGAKAATAGVRAVAQGEAAGTGGFVEVVKPGGLLTVQDLGRRGWAAVGVGLGGALDPWSAATANLAVGNAPGAAVLEATYVGPVLRFSAPTLIAAVGAETPGLPPGRPVAVAAGDVVDCASLTRGARLYLAVAGGWQVAEVLGGRGTQVGTGFGGFCGRALAAGDRLGYGETEAFESAAATWRLAAPVPVAGKRETVEVRLVPGPDWAQIFRRFGPGGAVRAVEARRFVLSAKSDRMGLRLSGEPFVLPGGAVEQPSRPVVPGTVQVPPDGLPIVLMTEGQTIGGYPQLGQVASVDLAKLAQARPGAEIVFKVVDVSAAQQARLRVAADVARLRVGLSMRGGGGRG